MRKSNIFEDSRTMWRQDIRRLDGRLVEYGHGWRSKTMPTSRFIIFWLEGTGEFYAQDTVSFICFLMDRKCPLEKDADHYLFNHLAKMEDSFLEDQFPEFAQIASPACVEASHSPETPKAESQPNPYAKWLKTPVNNSGSKHGETKTADQLWNDIPAASPADFSDRTDPPF